jgi:nucleotide-binding universal stress UspA family protein
MFKRILVPIDGSEPANRALDAAVELARRFDGALTILCVYRHHSPLESSLSMVRATDKLETPDEALKAYAKELVKAAKERALAAGAATVEAFAKRGHPARAIVGFADDHGCDAIVMGTRGLGDFGGHLLGSVSHKVTSMAKVTCVLIK